jgi:hypothetical protein
MTEPAQPSPSAILQVTVPTGLDDLRDTVKWLIASAAAVTAVLVAAVQFKGLGQLANAGLERQAIAAVAAFSALTVILLVVVKGAQILATPHLSLNDLADRELQAGGITLKVRIQPLPDTLIQEILERRSFLLDGQQTISDFYTEYRDLMQGRDAVVAGRTAMMAGRQLDGSIAGDRETAERLAALVEKKVERLEAEAQFLTAQDRFRRLSRWFPLGGFILVLAIVTMAILTTWPQGSVQISQPTPVTVYLKANPARYGFPASCTERELSGVAVGGTFEHPVVITNNVPGCPPTLLQSTGSGIVAVPSVP